MIVRDRTELETETVQVFADPATADATHKVLTHIVAVIVVPQVPHLAILRMVLEREENFARGERQLYPETDAAIPIKNLEQ